MTVRDYLASIVRTVVPTVVGLLLALAAKTGLQLDPGTVSMLVDALAVGAYHAGVRVLENRWPSFGVMLGWRAQPHYPGPTLQTSHPTKGQ